MDYWISTILENILHNIELVSFQMKKLVMSCRIQNMSRLCFLSYTHEKLELTIGIDLVALFSSAVFGENPRYCYILGVIVVQKSVFEVWLRVSFFLHLICECSEDATCIYYRHRPDVTVLGRTKW